MSKKDSKPKKIETPKKSQIEKETTGIEGSDDKNNSGNSSNEWSQELNQIIEELKQVKEDFKEELKNTKDFKRFKQAVVTFQDSLDNNAEEVKKLEEKLSDTQKLINDSLKQQLEETNENLKELIAQRQDNGELRREIEKWQDFAVDFFDSLERMSSAELDFHYKKAVEKVIEDFNRSVNNLGLERIIPSKGDDLKEELHEAIEKESADVESGKVIECKKWGYKINGKLYKPAQVFVAKQKTETSQGDTSVNTAKQGIDNPKESSNSQTNGND